MSTPLKYVFLVSAALSIPSPPPEAKTTGGPHALQFTWHFHGFWGLRLKCLCLHIQDTLWTLLSLGGVCDVTASVWDRLPKPTASHGNARGCENSTSSSPACPLRDKVLCVPCCQAQVSVAGAASTALEPHNPQKASGLVLPVLRTDCWSLSGYRKREYMELA